MKRVLLIEDDMWLGESYQRALSGVFDVTHVETLQAAVDAINQHVPDAIVADFMLDGRNSIELLHEIRSYDDTVDVPVVIVSTLGAELSAYAEQLEHYGVVAIHDKADVTPTGLRRTVQESIAAREHA